MANISSDGSLYTERDSVEGGSTYRSLHSLTSSRKLALGIDGRAAATGTELKQTGVDTSTLDPVYLVCLKCHV